MMMEVGAIIYAPGPEGEEKRIREWGRHCDWPPLWIDVPDHIKEVYTPQELESLRQAWFQRKCYEALDLLYNISVASSLPELMDYCKKLPFWINPSGMVTFSPEDEEGVEARPLWEQG